MAGGWFIMAVRFLRVAAECFPLEVVPSYCARVDRGVIGNRTVGRALEPAPPRIRRSPFAPRACRSGETGGDFPGDLPRSTPPEFRRIELSGRRGFRRPTKHLFVSGGNPDFCVT